MYIFHSANCKYRNKDNKNKWSTTDSKQRSVWYYTLTNEKMLENYVTWLNEIECPQCKQVVDKNSSKFAPDIVIIIVISVMMNWLRNTN